MRIALLCPILCLAFGKINYAQPKTIHKLFSFSPYPTSVFNSVVVTDSCYYISGIIADSLPPYRTGALFVKTDLQGTPLVVKGYTDPVDRYETWFQSLSLDGQACLATHGYNYAQDTNVLFFIRYDATGNIKNLSNFRAVKGSIQEIPYDMVRFGADQYMLCVAVTQTGGNSALYLVKLNQVGTPEFVKPVSSQVNTIALNRINTTPDGGFVVGGLGSNQNTNSKNIIMQTVLAKFDSLGNKQWDYLSPAEEDWLGTLGGLVVNENHEIVFGTAQGKAIPINSSSEYFVWNWCLVKMDMDRKILWKTFFRPTPEAFQDTDRHLWNMIALRDNKGYVAVGQNFEAGPRWHGWIVKAAENGDSLWMRKYNFEGLNIVYELKDLQEDKDGYLVMVGEYRDISKADVGQKAWLLKVDPYGCLVPGCHLVATKEASDNTINLLLYPNPASDFLHFYCAFPPSINTLTYTIVDGNGRACLESGLVTNAATHILPVNALPPGNYFLQLSYNGEIVKAAKFMVLR